MFFANLVGSVLSSKLEKKLIGNAKERVQRGVFYFRLGKALATRVESESEALAEEAAEAVRQAVPVDKGNLRDSVRVVKSKKGVRVVEGGTPETMKPFANGAVFDQALGVEFGTSKTSAQPHYFPTVRRYDKTVGKRLKEAVEDEVS